MLDTFLKTSSAIYAPTIKPKDVFSGVKAYGGLSTENHRVVRKEGKAKCFEIYRSLPCPLGSKAAEQSEKKRGATIPLVYPLSGEQIHIETKKEETPIEEGVRHVPTLHTHLSMP